VHINKGIGELMIQPIQPSDSTSPIAISQTPEEKQKSFEIQFETEVLSAYVSITGQNGSVKQHLSKLKNGLASGQAPDQLAAGLNQVISQINNQTVPEENLPAFGFSSDGNQTQAVGCFGLTLEKLLHVASEKGNIQWKDEEKLFGELSSLIYNVEQMIPEQAFKKLNGIIEEANNNLPAQYKLPAIPFTQRR